MKREALLRQLRKEAKAKNLEMLINKKSGKGSHYVVRLGERWSTVQSGELNNFHVQRIRKQLGL